MMKKYKMDHPINVGFICPNDYWEQFHKNSRDAHVKWDLLRSKVNRIMEGEEI